MLSNSKHSQLTPFKIKTSLHNTRLHVSKLYATRNFTDASLECKKNLHLMDLHIIHVYLATSAQLGTWDEVYTEICGLYNGHPPVCIITQAALMHCRNGAYTAAKELVEEWMVGLDGDRGKAYARLIDVYVTALAGLDEFETAREFLNLNSWLAPSDKELLLRKLADMQHPTTEPEAAVEVEEEVNDVVELGAEQSQVDAKPVTPATMQGRIAQEIRQANIEYQRIKKDLPLIAKEKILVFIAFILFMLGLLGNARIRQLIKKVLYQSGMQIFNTIKMAM
jgi:hypothetical protein